MKLKELLKKLGLAILSISLLTPMSTFASDEFSGVDYPSRINNIPAVYISRIDFTNNELEFTLNTLEGKKLARFGAAWVKDRSDEYLNADARSYPSVDEVWSEKIFWSDDYDLDIESYHSNDSSFFKRYTVDAIVDLKDNIYWDMYYIAETTDGIRWVNKVTYGNCGSVWQAGKACIGNVFRNETEVDNVQYFLRDAPEKFTKTEIPRVVVIPDPEPTVEPEPTPESEPVVEPEPTFELESTPEPELTMGSETTIEPEATVNETENISKPENDPVLITGVEVLATQGLTDTDNDINEEFEDNIIEELEDFNEFYEGFGDSTLGVPILGGVNEDGEEPECEEINVLMYFIFGAAVGAILAWFLSFIIKMISTSKELKYKE